MIESVSLSIAKNSKNPLEIKWRIRAPVKARHAEYSMIFSADDDVSRPSKYLLSLALAAIAKSTGISLDDISARIKHPSYWPDIWPGENYKLLAGFVLTLKPKLVIEIGTGTGLSALSMKKYLPSGSRIVTFDIIDWKSTSDSYLSAADFADEKLIQYNDDLSNSSIFLKHRELLVEGNIIFIDAAKDGVMEQKLIDNLKKISFKANPLIVFDDIRVWNMLKVWRNISFPKLDLTSFGHWSGTGIVEWSDST